MAALNEYAKKTKAGVVEGWTALAGAAGWSCRLNYGSILRDAAGEGTAATKVAKSLLEDLHRQQLRG